MKLLDFSNMFPNEEACIEYMRTKREQQGIQCKVCAGEKHYWLSAKKSWKCANCGSRSSLKGGTMMEKSKIPLLDWFKAIHLITATKKSFSGLELQRQLNYNRYEPVWYMLNKIRIMMGKRDAKYKLNGELEIDDAYFEIVDLTKPKDQKQKTGRGSDRQLKVLVMVESTPVIHLNEENKHKYRYKPKRKMGYMKMIVIDDVASKTINYEVNRLVLDTSKVITDAWRGYSRLKNVVAQHEKMVVPAKQAGKALPWVHIVISNAKKLLLDTHHSIGKEYLQNYLNEYCYKLNRRYMSESLLDRIITAGIQEPWYK